MNTIFDRPRHIRDNSHSQSDAYRRAPFRADGQQRLTSLYQALFSGKPVTTRDTRRNAINRWYYLDINKALDPHADREDAIISLPEDRKLRNFRGEAIADYSTVEKECAVELLPLPLVFDIPAQTKWQMQYVMSDDPLHFQAKMLRWNTLLQTVILPMQQYQVPIIVLGKETPKEAVCQVFEKVNTGGVSLTVFELLTATFAADDYNLREDWARREKRLRQHKVLAEVKSDELLQAISLLASYTRRQRTLQEGIEADKAPGITCKRKDLLRLTLGDYETWADGATRGFEDAARFVHSQKIYAARDLPYRTQLVPLAAVFAVLGESAESDSVRRSLAQWFWCGIFGELYGSATETRFAKDLPELLRWLDGGNLPDTVSDANFAPARLLGLRTRNSAAYKGLYALLLRDGGLDFRTGEPTDSQMYFDDAIDIHHIFPQAWCRTNGVDARRCDSVINKTALSARTNRIVVGNAPSIYLERLRKNVGIREDRMNDILRSHVINSDALSSDDFNEFFNDRERALLDRIETAMGKPLAREMFVAQDATTETFDYEEVIA